jgi:CAAX prenyl protease-like protein
MWPRILPFATYMAFIAISAVLPADSFWELWLYPIKIIGVLGLLIFFWSSYHELQRPVMTDAKEAGLAIAVGLAVYLLWVRMDWPWAMQGEATDYNPFEAGATIGVVLAGIRVFGAAVVVPLMEELFWRSYLIRWIANPDEFGKIPLGTFTLGSFAVTVVLFGLEHNLWLAGMMAGAIYNGLLYQTQRLWPCVIAHATTNLALGLHVLITQEWQWW